MKGMGMRVRVTLTIETEMKVSINSLQSLFGDALENNSLANSVKVEGMSVADIDDEEWAKGHCMTCGNKEVDK